MNENVKSEGPKREIFANKSFEETRIAIVEDGRLAELYWERESKGNIVGNIYKASVDNVLPGISSAFINVGTEKNAYIYISDVLGGQKEPIENLLRKDQEVMVQVTKGAISTKGMKVSMDISLPGRYLVLTPYQDFVGVSKNIQSPEERNRLSEIMRRLANPEIMSGKGCIVRTEAEGATEKELDRELRYLLRLWDSIMLKYDSSKPPCLLHSDMDMTVQVARDILSENTSIYMLDDYDAYKTVDDFVSKISPELRDKIRYYDGRTPIFKAFDVEKEIDTIRKIKVPLQNGGSLVIQEAESLCAIDVNTGRFTGNTTQEDTVTATNLEAAKEIARQLRLRNIGGIIVIDFIDMKKAANRHKLIEALQEAVKYDRAKIRILPITRLGLVEMTRERKRQSTLSLITEECPECHGSGRVMSRESLIIKLQREMKGMTMGRPGGIMRLVVNPVLCEEIKRQQDVFERNIHRSFKLSSDPLLSWEDYRIVLE